MQAKLRRALSLTPRDWGILTEAWLTLLWVDFTISCLPYPWWKGWLAQSMNLSSPAVSPNPEATERLVYLINAAANHHIGKPTCLRRSLTLREMLKRRKIPAILRMGIRKEGSRVDAHAWTECNGTVINDSPDVSTRFSPLPTLSKELLQQIHNQ